MECFNARHNIKIFCLFVCSKALKHFTGMRFTVFNMPFISQMKKKLLHMMI
jgi:hypothetical protein